MGIRTDVSAIRTEFSRSNNTTQRYKGQISTARETDRETTYQLSALPALVVCEEAESLVAVTFQQDHSSRWPSVPEQTETRLTLACTKL